VDRITYRWMDPDEIVRVGEIDRSERIRIGYEMRDGHLHRMEVDWDAPNFLAEGEGEHTIYEQIRFCREHIDRGAVVIGAFDDDTLVGIGVLTPGIGEGLAQLAYLQVSNGYRHFGIGTRLLHEMLEQARRMGAEGVYVSATPSGSAVSFYLKNGFTPTDSPIPELFALEPEDIHMIRTLGG
jgi:N-acetylglutamate synthase-like GNAT family acetyltransferase